MSLGICPGWLRFLGSRRAGAGLTWLNLAKLWDRAGGPDALLGSKARRRDLTWLNLVELWDRAGPDTLPGE